MKFIKMFPQAAIACAATAAALSCAAATPASAGDEARPRIEKLAATVAAQPTIGDVWRKHYARSA